MKNIKPAKAIQQPEFITKRPVILILDAPPAEGTPEAEVLREAGMEAEFVEAESAGLARADFILTWRREVNGAMILPAKRCLMITHYGPGAGRETARVAMEAARRAGIYVSSVPDYAPVEWAQATFSLIGELCGGKVSGLPARGLKELRLGIIGLGSVGRVAAKMGRERGMDVWAHDPFAGPENFSHLELRRADLPDLMGIADIVSLHVPLGPATRWMIGEKELALLKPGSLLVNTAAPELIDFDALATAMNRGRPIGAAFDEDLSGFLPTDHALIRMPNVIHAARRAGMSREAALACRETVARLIVHVLAGNRPPHLLIDPPCPRHILLLANQSWA